MAESRRVDTGIVQRGKTYTFIVSMGRDIEGKQIRKTTTFRPPEGLTQRKADKLAKEEYTYFVNRCKNATSYNENIRFADLCADYLRDYTSQIKESTYRNYEAVIRRYFIPDMGTKKIKEINRNYLSSYFLSLCSTKNLKENTVRRRIYIVMTSIMRYACNMGLISVSPCHGVLLPKDVGKEEKPNRALTFDEIGEFLAYFNQNEQLDRLVLFLLNTGLRIGEALGLTWENVNFADKSIYICQILSGSGSHKYMSTPKTKTSCRTVFLNDTTIEVLKEQKKYHDTIVYSLDSCAFPQLVFISQKGDAINLFYPSHRMAHRLKGTKYADITPHNLRHTNATLLLNSGIDLKVISEHLGHADIQTTAKIYVDVLRTSQQNIASKMEDILLHV